MLCVENHRHPLSHNNKESARVEAMLLLRGACRGGGGGGGGCATKKGRGGGRGLFALNPARAPPPLPCVEGREEEQKERGPGGACGMRVRQKAPVCAYLRRRWGGGWGGPPRVPRAVGPPLLLRRTSEL